MANETACRADTLLAAAPKVHTKGAGAVGREWMLRVETVIFAAAEPVSRETLTRVVGMDRSIDLSKTFRKEVNRDTARLWARQQLAPFISRMSTW